MPIKTDDTGLQKKLNALDKSLKSRKDRFVTGKFIVEMIVKRTRDKGQGVSRTGARTSKLRKVSPGWAIARQKESRHPNAASGRESNLTFKGTMLDSLTVLGATKDKFFIGFRTSEQADKAEGNALNGRPFMFLSKGEITKTSDFIKKQILK